MKAWCGYDKPPASQSENIFFAFRKRKNEAFAFSYMYVARLWQHFLYYYLYMGGPKKKKNQIMTGNLNFFWLDFLEENVHAV